MEHLLRRPQPFDTATYVDMQGLRPVMPPDRVYPDGVSIYHPSQVWRHGGAPFLTLPAYDLVGTPADGNQPRFGVLHQMVLDACYVLSSNRAGFLSDVQNPVQPMLAQEDQALLLPGRYYYHAGHRQGDECTCSAWKVCTDFSSWPFPSDEDLDAHLPHWSPNALSQSEAAVPAVPQQIQFNQTSLRTALAVRDGLCILTGSGWGESSRQPANRGTVCFRASRLQCNVP